MREGEEIARVIDVTFKGAKLLPGWREIAERQLRRALLADGCFPETVELSEPYEAEDEHGAPLERWRIEGVGVRE